QNCVQQLPPAPSEDEHADLEDAGRDCDDAEENRDRVDRRVVEAQRISAASVQPMAVVSISHHGCRTSPSSRSAAPTEGMSPPGVDDVSAGYTPKARRRQPGSVAGTERVSPATCQTRP